MPESTQTVAPSVTEVKASVPPPLPTGEILKTEAKQIPLNHGEATVAGNVILFQAQENAANEYQKMPADPDGTIINDPKNADLARLVISRNMRLLTPEALAKHTASRPEELRRFGLILPESTRIQITDSHGASRTLYSISQVDDDSFRVFVKDTHNSVAQELGGLVSRQDLVKAEIVQNIAPNLDKFPEKQQKLLRSYIDVLSGKQTGNEPIQFDEAQLKEVLSEAWILTSFDVETLVNHFLTNKTPPEGAKQDEITLINAENEMQAAKRDKIIKSFKDKGALVIEPSQIKSLFSELRINAVGLDQIKSQAIIQVTKLESLLKTKIGDPYTITGDDGKLMKVKFTERIKKDLTELLYDNQALQLTCEEAIKTFNEDGPLKYYFDQLQAGTLSQEEGQLVVESFRSGEIAKPPDMSEIETAAGKISNPKKELLNKLYDRREFLKKSGKNLLVGGGGFLSILDLFSILAKKETP
jgi:hypothetical protein